MKKKPVPSESYIPQPGDRVEAYDGIHKLSGGPFKVCLNKAKEIEFRDKAGNIRFIGGYRLVKV